MLRSAIKPVSMLAVLAFSLSLTACKTTHFTLADLEQLGGVSVEPTTAESNDAIKQSLASGLSYAVSNLGREGGFYGTGFKIPLPNQLEKTANVARKLGLNRYVDRFELSMNRAAEKAVPLAANVFSDAVSQMSVSDAVGLLTGGQNSVTDYFKRVSSAKLKQQFLPIVTQATQSVNVTKNYKDLLRSTNMLSLLSGDSAAKNLDVDSYITQKAVDALFVEVAKQERTIRANPMQAGTALMRRVFSYYR